MILKPTKNEIAYLKMGMYGEAGSGKTFTSSLVAIGLHRFIKSNEAIGFIDTETGSSFVLHLFKDAKIKLLTAKTRAFADLLTILDEAEKNCSILILDSITHFWNELLDAYQKKHNLNRITLRHWIPIKQTWREFTDRYVNSRLHIIMCGRAGIIWDDVEDEEGIKELKKVGTKLKAEVETSFEPSLLVEMVKERTSNRPGKTWIHRAYIIKDRFDIIDGQFFDEPKFEDFLPHISRLNIGGEHKALDVSSNSQALFNNPGLGEAKYKEKKILLDEITDYIRLIYPSQSEQDKTGRIKILMQCANTSSWNAITDMGNDKLKLIKEAIKEIYEKEKTKND